MGHDIDVAEEVRQYESALDEWEWYVDALYDWLNNYDQYDSETVREELDALWPKITSTEPEEQRQIMQQREQDLEYSLDDSHNMVYTYLPTHRQQRKLYRDVTSLLDRSARIDRRRAEVARLADKHFDFSTARQESGDVEQDAPSLLSKERILQTIKEQPRKALGALSIASLAGMTLYKSRTSRTPEPDEQETYSFLRR